MMTTGIRPYIAVLIWALIFAGCSVLAPQPDRTQYFILTPMSEGSPGGASQQPIASSSELVIAVGPIKFPGYLGRSEVVTRSAGNRLEVSDQKRWGERLDKNFENVLCENLSQLLGTQRVITFPWYGKARIDYEVEVRVERFETTSDGQSRLSATWTIRNGQDGTELATNRLTTSTPVGGDDSGGSAALSHCVAELSREIAARIVELKGRSMKRTTTRMVPIPRASKLAV